MMILSMAACAQKKPVDTPPSSTAEPSATPTPDDTSSTEGGNGEVVEPSLADNATDAFSMVLDGEKAATMSTEEIAQAVATDKSLTDAFDGLECVKVEPGFLAGFKAEITGFKEGYQIAPVIGSIPFVACVFKLENINDYENFMIMLDEQHNMRWNVCTEADDMRITRKNDLVFFIMSPDLNKTDEERGADIELPPELIVAPAEGEAVDSGAIEDGRPVEDGTPVDTAASEAQTEPTN